MARRIYAASSWRNLAQPGIVTALRKAGHRVYDFRNPTVEYDNPVANVTHGFQWSEIDPMWERWTSKGYRDSLADPIAKLGFRSDYEAMRWADTGVLIMPSGRSAHLEAGYFNGAGKDLFILLAEQQEPELMYLMANHVCLDVRELLDALGGDS